MSGLISEVADVLRDECGWRPTDNDMLGFAALWPDCGEYRFMGSLGFGGKVWSNRGRLYVTCYPEDRTPERQAAIDWANARLATLEWP